MHPQRKHCRHVPSQKRQRSNSPAQSGTRNGASKPLVQRFARAISRPALCWTVSALTLLGWHVPAVFTLGMHSEVWHLFEQASFWGAGFLFWLPVIQPWPSVSTEPQWSTLLYLFLATLPFDILSGFLVFSDRVAYPAYFSIPRHFAISVLDDQQCAPS